MLGFDSDEEDCDYTPAAQTPAASSSSSGVGPSGASVSSAQPTTVPPGPTLSTPVVVPPKTSMVVQAHRLKSCVGASTARVLDDAAVRCNRTIQIGSAVLAYDVLKSLNDGEEPLRFWESGVVDKAFALAPIPDKSTFLKGDCTVLCHCMSQRGQSAAPCASTPWVERLVSP